MRLRMGSVEEGGLGAGRTLLNITARRSVRFVSISVADLFVGRHSAGRPGLDFASVGQASDSVSGRTYRTCRPVDSADHTCWHRFVCHRVSLMVGNIRQLSITVVRSGKAKRKPFNSNLERPFVTIAPLAFSYPRVSSDRDAVSATHRAVAMRLSEPRIGPSTRCRRREYEGTSSSRLPLAIYSYFATVVFLTSMPSLISSP